MRDPRRVLESADHGALERILLESASAPGPSDTECDATWAALAGRLGLAASGVAAVGAASHAVGHGASTLGGGAAGTAPTPIAAWGGAAAQGSVGVAGAKALGMGLLVKGVSVFIVAVGTAMAVAGVHGGGHPTAATAPAPRAAERSAVTSTEAATPASPGPTVAAAVPAPTAPTVAAAVPSFGHAVPSFGHAVPSFGHARSSKLRAPDAKTAEPSTPLGRESELVTQARDDVRSGRCGEALDLLRQGDERLGNGALGQERDALRVEALGCAGRRQEATAAAEAFARAYPNSPHGAAVRATLAEPAE